MSVRAASSWILLVAAIALIRCAHTTSRVPESGERVHVVAAGENPSAIARRYGVSAEALMARNGIDDPRRLTVGERLIIPAGGVLEREGAPVNAEPRRAVPLASATHDEDALPQLPAPPPAPDLHALRQTFQRSTQAGSAPLIWPVDGVVISLFGHREGQRHDGIDIGAPLGSAIYAAADGEVVFAGEQPGYGQLVILAHGEELVTIYAHNAANLAKEGDRVQQGDPIAQVGQSGGQASPALHFEVRVRREPVNPLPRLPEG